VTSIDSSAIHALKDIRGEYNERGIQRVFSNPNSDVLSTMRTTGLSAEKNADWVFVHTADAVRSCVLAMKEEDIRAATQFRGSENARADSSLEQSVEP
jgi:hypothetical protein